MSRLSPKSQRCFPLLRSHTSEICTRSMSSLTFPLTTNLCPHFSDIMGLKQWSCQLFKLPSIPLLLLGLQAFTRPSHPDMQPCQVQHRGFWLASLWQAHCLQISILHTWHQPWGPGISVPWISPQDIPPPDLALQHLTWTPSTWAVLKSVDIFLKAFLNHSHHLRWN